MQFFSRVVFNSETAEKYVKQAIVNVTTKKGDSGERKVDVYNKITPVQLANMEAEFIRYGRFLSLFEQQNANDDDEFKRKEYVMHQPTDTVEVDVVV